MTAPERRQDIEVVPFDPQELLDNHFDATDAVKDLKDEEHRRRWEERQASLPPLRMVQRFGDSEHEPLRSPPSVFDGIRISTNDLVGIVAPRGAGKTWLAMDFAAGLAEDISKGLHPFFLFDVFRVNQRLRVAYVHGELDDDDTTETRWEMLTAFREIDDEYLTEYFPPDNGGPHLSLEAAIENAPGPNPDSRITRVTPLIDPRLEEIITSRRHDVVILDPWASFFDGEENSNRETKAVLNALWFLARSNGVMLVFLHHPPKGATRTYDDPTDMWRGAGVLADRCSVRITAMKMYGSEKSKALDNIPKRERQKYMRDHLRVSFLVRNGITPDDVYVRMDENRRWRGWSPPAEVSGEERSKDIPDDVVLEVFKANDGEFTSQAAASRAIEIELKKRDIEPPSKRTIDRELDERVASEVLDTFKPKGNQIGYRLRKEGG